MVGVTRSITLAGDDRGRVPFALVGVVLLLGSVAYANTLALRGPVVVDTAADDALDRAESTARPAVRTAATAAAREAALHPVTDPADGAVGRELDPNAPFRDALRLRIAVATTDALSRTATDAGGVTATASMPAIESASDVPAAIDRVEVEPIADGTAMRVTVRNVTLTARRNGDAVTQRRVNYTVAVAVPTLAMHDRTERYEARLNRSPFEGAGLGRALTWRLWTVAQARGTAQYLGAPVSNVLANRHLELSTNAAALRAQEAAFGRSDPEGRAAMVRATARVGATDLLTPAMDRGPAWTDRVLDTAADSVTDSPGSDPDHDSASVLRPPASGNSAAPDDAIRVGVNATADAAFLRVIDADGGLDPILRDAYRARAIREVSVERETRGTLPARTAPGPNWTFVTATTTRSVSVVDRSSVPASEPRSVADERRTVEVRDRVTRYWLRNRTVRRTTATRTSEYRVRIAVSLAYAPTVGPDRPTDPVFVRGGALDGPNLADASATAREELLSPGEADRIAREVVPDDGHSTDSVAVVGSRPADIGDWVYRDLVGLRERVRNVSVAMTRAAVASGDANAPASLAAEIRERRASLVDAPETYDGAADRARVAARAAYIDAVLAELDRRAGGTDDRAGDYRDAVAGATDGVGDRLGDLATVAADATAPEPSPAGSWRAGEVVLTPDADPGYLPVTAVESDRIASVPTGETVHPLVARNTNLFTLPTGDVADAVTDTALPERRRASLSTAGRVLVAAETTAATAADTTTTGDGSAEHGAGDDSDAAADRAELRDRVDDELAAVDDRALDVLEETTALSAGEREAAVSAARERWPAPGPRALAVTNGSYATAIAAAAADEIAAGTDESGSAVTTRDRLAVRLRVELAATAADATVSVPQGMQAGVVDATREKRRDALRRAAKGAAENATERVRQRYADHAFGGVTAGLPVAPVPAYWYATVNVWDVAVAGTYPRFAVTAPVGGPDGGDSRIRYVRDGALAELDVDGDGDPERLGHAERVSFHTRTAVVVVVPAGRSGVGDVTGEATESSPGWPCPPSEIRASARGDDVSDTGDDASDRPEGACR
ncbi:hypothetical protein Hbl1158_07395 [Halobaculum sp. CBA1158]|uniref:DUF7286 family protein n=1 Tax=Halobaculum sp. CBA1158 TaxID=2904243 RepID=UPI001F2312E1|nr:hypothetical protein [Halobaculum sp. CBA1158]UIP01163.1 hypothetical protein Hbl1158_07395 [Halobaculum sp. CBA1158]